MSTTELPGRTATQRVDSGATPRPEPKPGEECVVSLPAVVGEVVLTLSADAGRAWYLVAAEGDRLLFSTRYSTGLFIGTGLELSEHLSLEVENPDKKMVLREGLVWRQGPGPEFTPWPIRWLSGAARTALSDLAEQKRQESLQERLARLGLDRSAPVPMGGAA